MEILAAFLAHINKMGGTKHRDLHILTKRMWEWCIERELWIFAEYVASKENPADEGSRLSNPDTEWELSNAAFQDILETFGTPSIDLFASRVNAKCSRYCSWDRDPEAIAINALTISWKAEFWYVFPPFSLIPKLLKKIKEEKSTGILVVPYWPGQPWYPDIKNVATGTTLAWTPSTKLLNSPCRKLVHPLAHKFSLAAAVLSGNRSKENGSERNHGRF